VLKLHHSSFRSRSTAATLLSASLSKDEGVFKFVLVSDPALPLDVQICLDWTGALGQHLRWYGHLLLPMSMLSVLLATIRLFEDFSSVSVRPSSSSLVSILRPLDDRLLLNSLSLTVVAFIFSPFHSNYQSPVSPITGHWPLLIGCAHVLCCELLQLTLALLYVAVASLACVFLALRRHAPLRATMKFTDWTRLVVAISVALSLLSFIVRQPWKLLVLHKALHLTSLSLYHSLGAHTLSLRAYYLLLLLYLLGSSPTMISAWAWHHVPYSDMPQTEVLMVGLSSTSVHVAVHLLKSSRISVLKHRRYLIRLIAVGACAWVGSALYRLPIVLLISIGSLNASMCTQIFQENPVGFSKKIQ